MQLLKELPFARVMFSEVHKVIETSWKDGNSEMTEEELRNTIENVAELIQTHRPMYFLADDSNRHFIYEVHIQDWVAQRLTTACVLSV